MSGGNVSISTSEPKFGTGKLQFGYTPTRDGFVKSPNIFDFGNKRPFTISFFYRDGDGNGCFFTTSYSPIYTPMVFGRGGYVLVGNAALSDWTIVAVYMNISSTAYQHCAVVGDGTNIKFYRDGSLIATTPHPNWASASWPIQLGKYGDSSYSNGGMDEFLLYDDVLWTSNFTPPTAPFTYVDYNTVLWLKFEGANGSTIFTDSSSQNNTITRYGSPSITTSNSKFGNSCLGINATSYLKINRSESFDIGAGQPFTIQMWLYITGGTGAYGGLISMRDAPVYCPIETNITNNGTLSIKIGNATLTDWDSSSFTMSTYVWRHFAIVGDGSLIKVYNHGVQSAAFAQPHWPNDEYPLQINRNGDNQMQSCANIDHLSFHKTALWLSDFTPPTSEFTY